MSNLFFFSFFIQAEADVDKFLKQENNTFDAYCREVRKYHKLVDEISYKSRKVIRLGMFEVHCDELIKGLAKRADALCTRLLARMAKDHQEANKAYVQTVIIFFSGFKKNLKGEVNSI